MYSLASVFEMVYFPAFNVSMFIWSLPVAVPFFISRSAAFTSHDGISGRSLILGQCGLWYYVHCRIPRCRIPLFGQ